MLIAIFICIVLLTLGVTAYLVKQIQLQPKSSIALSDGIRLLGSGILAFISDTLGVGSFAVNIALAKLLGTFADEELPAMCNIAQLIPGTVESLFFMKYVDVDMTTLTILVLGTSIGGLLGGAVVSRMSKQAIRLAMVISFSCIILLLISNQCHWLPMGGDAMALHSWKLWVGFFGLMICGALTSVGIGLFAMVQAVLFLLSMSPLVAFPIMMTAGAMQQPLTVITFLRQRTPLPLKRILALSLGGVLGVFIILPVFNYLTVSWLRNLLIGILCFNLIAITRTFLRERSMQINVLAET